VARLATERVSLQVAALGPVTPREIGTIVILALTVAGWIAAPWLRVDLATIALLGLLACVGLGTFRPAGAAVARLGLPDVLRRRAHRRTARRQRRLDRLAGAAVDRLLGAAQPSPLVFVLAVAGVSVLVRLALDQDLAVVLLAVTLLPVASRLGVEPWLVVIALLATSVAWFLPSQTPSYLVAQSASEGRLFSHAQRQRFALA